MELDSFDCAILRLIQEDAGLPQRALAERVHLSISSINRRIARMREDKVIERITAQVAPAAVGRPITIIAVVTLESEKVEDVDRMKERLRASEAVQQIYYVTGDADFVVILTVSDMAEYEGLTRRLFFASGNVKRFTTMVAMDRVKVGLTLPV